MIIKDIWLTLKITMKTFMGLIFPNLIISFLLTMIIQNNNVFIISFISFFLVSLIFTIKVYISYNKGYVIDTINKTFTFPASDVENSILDIILFKTFFNLIKRKTIKFEDILSMNNETMKRTNNKNKSVKWLLNISGHFGSQQLEFDSKQKRDECRSALSFHSKGRNSSDLNSDI
jgi:hypothetical protein